MLPRDPFANAPYRYERMETGYRLWSVGPDAVDDEGDIAIDRYKWQSNIPSGDIVIERPTTRG